MKEPGASPVLATNPSLQRLHAERDRLGRTTWLAALREHQTKSWQRGERVLVELYLEQVPALGADTEGVLDLLYAEVLLREGEGETPQPHEFCERFPHLAEQINRQFAIHQALASQLLQESVPLLNSGITSEPETATFDVDPGNAPTRRSADSTIASSASSTRCPDDYEILEELGQGGMGVVHKARQVKLNRLVALKEIRAGFGVSADERARFRTEAEAAARLQHPNIVQIYEVGEWRAEEGAPPVPYMALEYVQGGSLDKRIAGTPQEPRLAAQLVETLAGAVQAAHAQGIIHRDLKPANILIADCRSPIADCKNLTAQRGAEKPSAQSAINDLQSAIPKITDFGLAKLLDADSGQTKSGAILGTPSYMAPEQARGGRDIGPAVDIYALGAILYEMLTGRPPFKGPTWQDTLLQVQLDEPVAPSRLQPKVPADLETICLKCLQKDPRRRYESAAALAEDLHRFREGLPIAARPIGQTERLWRWCRRNPRVAGLMAALFAVLVGGFTSVTLLWLLAEERRENAEASEQQQKQSAQRALEESQRAKANLQVALKAGTTQYLSTGPVASTTAGTFSYKETDIRSVGGSSGAPVYVNNVRVGNQTWNNVIVGINVRSDTGTTGSATAIRITSAWSTWITNTLALGVAPASTSTRSANPASTNGTSGLQQTDAAPMLALPFSAPAQHRNDPAPQVAKASRSDELPLAGRQDRVAETISAHLLEPRSAARKAAFSMAAEVETDELFAELAMA